MKRISLVSLVALVAACGAAAPQYARGQLSTAVENARVQIFAGETTARVIATETGDGMGKYRIAALTEVEVASFTHCRAVSVAENNQVQAAGTMTTTLLMQLSDCPPV